MPPVEILVFVAFVFIAAGLVKGLTGLGMPATALGLMLLAIDLKQAIVILLVPLFVTNVWQALVGRHLGTTLRRLWTLFLAGVLAIWFAVGVMVKVDTAMLTVALGIILIGYSGFSLATPQIRPSGRLEPLLSPLAGAATGLIGGLTGSLAVPAVLYMQALGMARAQLIQAMGIWFTVATVALSVSLGGRGALPPELAMVSAGAVLPALAGMELGRRLRERLAEELFRKVFFGVLMGLGLYITARGIFQCLMQT
ncbi:MAG: sulfite exporter TauE/SafE family protein [Rhodospirillaceae bacterium]